MRVASNIIWSRVIEAGFDECLLAKQLLTDSQGLCMVSPDWVFPTGLAYRLINKGMQVEGLPVYPEYKDIDFGSLLNVNLRDYQKRAVLQFMNVGRGIAAHATGAGKTVLLGAIMQVVGPPSICIVDTISSAEQLRNRLASYGIRNVGIVGGGNRKIGDHTCFVIDSAYLALKKQHKWFMDLLNNARLLALDEAHHAGSAKTWVAVGLSCPAPYRLGLTATPYDDFLTSADLLMEGVLGPVFDYIPSIVLRREGWLAEPYVFLVPVTGGDRLPGYILDWNDIEEKGIVRHDFRNNLIVAICSRLAQFNDKSRILILVRRVEHGKMLANRINDSGIKAVYSYGSGRAYVTESKSFYASYSDIVKRFEGGDWSVLIGSSQIYDEAQDIPSVTDLIFAVAGRKTRRILQRLGRGERTGPGKKYVCIWDFYDSQHPSLRNQSTRRKQIYKEENIHVVWNPMVIQSILEGQCSPLSIIEMIRDTEGRGENEGNKDFSWCITQDKPARSV